MLDTLKSSLASIWGNKARSLLTVLGVVIGVTSVTILIALGQGLKKDVSSTIEGLGTNVVAVVAGKIDASGKSNINPADFISGDILTIQDVNSIQKIQSVKNVTPLSLVSGSVQRNGATANPVIFGAYPSILDSIQQLQMEKGSLFKTADAGPQIVLSNVTKTTLFGDSDPIGQTVTLGKTEFTVTGYLQKVDSSNPIGSQFGDLSIIPFNEATTLNKNQVKIARIILSVDGAGQVNTVKQSIITVMKANHGQDDFTVLTQDDILALFSTFLNLATAMVSAIAAISLVVGGIGIMNIMLVTVTERTREIGLRKAVGATSRAIMFQFLTEAVMITLLGGLLGLLIAYSLGLAIAAKSQLHPLFTAPTIITALGISVFIGVVFGLWPAMRAAKKDPIEALRYE